MTEAVIVANKILNELVQALIENLLHMLASQTFPNGFCVIMAGMTGIVVRYQVAQIGDNLVVAECQGPGHAGIQNHEIG